MKTESFFLALLVAASALRFPCRRLILIAPLATAPARAVKPVEPLDETTVRRYKAIYAAKERMPTKEQQTSYMKKVCDSGILGPSILGVLLCAGR